MGWTVQPLRLEDESFWTAWHETAVGRQFRHPCLESEFVRAAVRRFWPGDGRLWAARHPEEGTFAILQRLGNGRWMTYRTPALSISPVVCRDAAVPAPMVDLFRGLGAFAWSLRVFDCDPRYQSRMTSIEDARVCHLSTHTTVAIDTEGSFQTYWAQRSKKLRNRLSSSLRKGQAQGEVQLTCVRDVAAMPAAIAEHARLESSGWKGQHGSAMRVDDDYGRFYLEVMQSFAKRGEARAYQLRVGDRQIASQLCLTSGGTLITMKTAYLDEAAALSPGRLLDYLMLGQLFDDAQVQRVEFVIQASASDLAWATAHREMQQLDLLRVGALAGIVRMKRRRRSPARPADEAPEAATVNAP